jgi:hypothetical protein
VYQLREAEKTGAQMFKSQQARANHWSVAVDSYQISFGLSLVFILRASTRPKQETN